MISFLAFLPSHFKIFKTSIDDVDYRQVIRFLSNLSSIKVLELRTFKQSPADEFFILLYASTRSPPFLPHLQSLEFVCDYNLSWEFLPQIFAVPCWQSLDVTINIVNPFPAKVMKQLEELFDRGFRFRVVQEDKMRSVWRSSEGTTYMYG
ncbi:hypothetical protein M413DRAFT_449436 [Hebeloma cylindrosporum]|uniref:F-box domain-containing protein n=1 Tax=Hebeloma cylindrosporum TaxID=76867 RepID=A0A0C2Y512_HEBCY|nr:hypothetical protein M413DRAFT_449436 [Hebeloma cylindrosporum h7]